MKAIIALVAGLLLLMSAIPSKADGLNVYVHAQTSTWQTEQLADGSVAQMPGYMTFWTFLDGLGGPASTWNATPFTLAAVENNSQLNDVPYYYPMYEPEALTVYPTKANDFWGWVHLTDVNGFVSGLPFEANGCGSANVRYQTFGGSAIADAATAGDCVVYQTGLGNPASDELAWLDTAASVDPPSPSPTPEPLSLLLLLVGLGVVLIAKC